jgi:hypothetical protein
MEEQRTMGTVLIVLFGILLPAVTLAIELYTGMCAETFFDPIATLGHVLLVAFVPLANLLALIGSSRQSTKWRTTLLWANGVALGIALIYTLVLLPITPLAVIAIICYGVGLLPLAPLCALLCGIALRRRLAAIPTGEVGGETGGMAVKPSKTLGPLLGGGALGIALLLAMEASVALTRIGVEMAASESHDREVRGVNFLRHFGNRNDLLRLCYQGGGGRGPFNFSSGSLMMCGFLFAEVPRDDVQKVFFRVTGLPYNSLPPPRGVSRFARDDFDFDSDVGGGAVTGRRKGLSLSDSRLDAQLQPNDATAQLEWTMVFKNDDQWQQREARAQVLLPPGGVVSRVTLWINGEPRDAAFAGAGQVREAYRKVVEKRRDPLLVTWAGSDRVLVQCFPVPANGEMKIRLGIIAPLTLTGLETAALRLPCFAERNFNITSRDIHSLWSESDRSYDHAPDKLHSEKQADTKYILRGTLADDELTAADAMIQVSRSGDVRESWTPDPTDPKMHVVQKLVANESSALEKLVVVIDGSAGMADQLETISEALASIPANTKLTVLVAGDDVVNVAAEAGSGDDSTELAARLRSVASSGGCDNVPALLRGFEEAASGDKTIVWIHAAQPVLLQPVTPLVHWLERGAQVTLYDLAVVNGPNRLVEQMGTTVACLKAVPRFGSVSDDLKRLLAQLTGQAKDYRLERTRVEGESPAKPKASSHLARLWAAGQASVLAKTGVAADLAQAVKLAAAFQLVTPVTGAVVLENQKQYEESKLHPADPDAVSNIPEPATWILLLTAAPWLLWLAWRRRRI